MQSQTTGFRREMQSQTAKATEESISIYRLGLQDAIADCVGSRERDAIPNFGGKQGYNPDSGGWG